MTAPAIVATVPLLSVAVSGLLTRDSLHSRCEVLPQGRPYIGAAKSAFSHPNGDVRRVRNARVDQREPM
jgi:hypothetical protein